MKDPHIRQEDHVQRELVLSQVLGLLEQQGLATTTLDKLAPQLDISKEELIRFWPYPGCLFIAACSFFPEDDHPIHLLAEQQKAASYAFTLALLQDIDMDDPEMVAHQMELVLEGCLSRLLVKRQLHDVETARRLAEDILQIARCRRNGALG